MNDNSKNITIIKSEFMNEFDENDALSPLHYNEHLAMTLESAINFCEYILSVPNFEAFLKNLDIFIDFNSLIFDYFEKNIDLEGEDGYMLLKLEGIKLACQKILQLNKQTK